MAAQGQTYLASSADNGSYTGNNNNDDGVYPADDAYVTAVGATDLTTTGPGGAWVSESAWVDSGGGPSDNGIAIPSWQVGVANSANGASTTLRNVPDVAMEVDTDNYACGNGSCYGDDGGTSYSTPRFAGCIALVNQQAVADGKATLGFLTPTLYTIGRGSSYDTDFHDITRGDSDCCGQSLEYSAVKGYDDVTGWGSPNTGLLAALVASTSSCPPTAITPYIYSSASGSWTEESSIRVGSGTTVDLGPQPSNGGSWRWTGPNGFTSTSRQINGIPLTKGTDKYVAAYTNVGGATSTETFTITVK